MFTWLLKELTTLAGPRMPGSSGDRIAVEWAVKRMKELGYDKVWTEPFDMEGWERIAESGSIRHRGRSQVVSLTALGGSVATPEGGITGEIVHFNTFQGLLDAAAETVDGKIVFISNRMERHRSGRGYGMANAQRTRGAAVAGDKGAIGIVIRSLGTGDH